jgi:hypothetical protein
MVGICQCQLHIATFFPWLWGGAPGSYPVNDCCRDNTSVQRSSRLGNDTVDVAIADVDDRWATARGVGTEGDLCCASSLSLSLFLTTPSFANSWGIDRSDAWWNPNESGWGVMMSQQQNSIFIATFLYGPDGKATWFTGLLAYNGSTYEGDLTASTGPSHLGMILPRFDVQQTHAACRCFSNAAGDR